MVCATMNQALSKDRQYIGFNMVFLYKAGSYVTGARYLRVGARYRVRGGELSGTSTYIRHLINQYCTTFESI